MNTIRSFMNILESAANDGLLSNPQFRMWFKNSKVIDHRGRPLMVYHGSSEKFTVFGGNTEERVRFKKDREEMISHLNRGKQTGAGLIDDHAEDFHYFSPHEHVADSFGQHVSCYYLSIQNPLDLTDMTNADLAFRAIGFTIKDKHDIVINMQDSQASMKEWAMSQGFDGILQPDSSGSSSSFPSTVSWVAFHPWQIKSVSNNSGSYDASDHDIRR